MKKKQIILLVFLMGVVINLWACDNGSSNGSRAIIQISGVAASGAPLNTAVVTAVNTHGDVAGPVDVNADGTYSLSIAKAPPYLLKADCESCDTALFSYANGEGTANITPLTNLTLFVAGELDTDLSDLYNSWVTASIVESEVMTAARKVNANLANIYTANEVDPFTYNFFTTPFTAAQRQGNNMDGVLDALDITLNAQGATIDQAIMIVANGGTDIIFDTAIDTSNIVFIDRITAEEAYAEVTSGGALIVCAYGDEACKSITVENSLTKSELAQQAASLPKSQKIIFYCT